MTQRASSIPQGFHTLSPYLIMEDAVKAIEFYKKAFGATELMRLTFPDGKIRHAEIKIGNSPLMLVDSNARFPQLQSFKALGGSPVQFFLYVEDVDALAEQFVAAGGKLIDEIQDKPDGDRRGGVEDPFGFVWWIASQREDTGIRSS